MGVEWKAPQKDDKFNAKYYIIAGRFSVVFVGDFEEPEEPSVFWHGHQDLPLRLPKTGFVKKILSARASKANGLLLKEESIFLKKIVKK